MKLITMLMSSAAALVLACLFGAVVPNAAAPCCVGAEASSAPTLDRLKALAGEWVLVDENGAPTEEISRTYRVTAGGSAVLEILFPGAEHEMVTMYHQDGDDLVLTHYCALGNQPFMKAIASDDPNVLEFNCDGGTYKDEHAESHMHQGRFIFIDKDHFSSEWLQYEKGEHVYTAAFNLARK